MKAAVSLDSILDTFTAEERADILLEADKLIKISRLAALRERIGWTQAALADRLETSQANVSQLEKQADPKLSTLRRYVKAIGGDLKLFADVPGLGMIDLSDMSGPELHKAKARAGSRIRGTARPSRA